MTGLGTVSSQTPKSACLLVIVIQVAVQLKASHSDAAGNH